MFEVIAEFKYQSRHLQLCLSKWGYDIRSLQSTGTWEVLCTYMNQNEGLTAFLNMIGEVKPKLDLSHIPYAHCHE